MMSFFSNNIMACYTSPMGILGQKLDETAGAGYYERVSDTMGIPQLWQIILGGGIVLALIVMLVALVKLLIVNYPKTVMQTKQKIAHGLAVVIILVMLASLFDTILSITQSAAGVNGTGIEVSAGNGSSNGNSTHRGSSGTEHGGIGGTF